MARGILVPQPGIKPVLLCSGSCNHWTAREFPGFALKQYSKI